ncbi:glycoside hydrolase family 30 protein [Nibrella viscosa]
MTSCRLNPESLGFRDTNAGGRQAAPAPTLGNVEYWLTKPDKSALFTKQSSTLAFSNTTTKDLTIDVDTTQTFQPIDGFGYTLTGGSAYVLNRMTAASRDALLTELFATTGNAIGVSYLRLSIGASDLSQSVFSYDDMPAGQTDPNLTNFNISPERADLLPVLKQILTLNPALKIVATPWSPPGWMKTNISSVGGSLKPEYYLAYANYFVKYIQAMKAEGVSIDAITVQNEPLNPNNNPSMVMTAAEQGSFIKNNLGPALRNAGLTTKIILYDHNCDNPNYPISILNDPAAKQYIDGSAFHLYAGDISAMSQVRAAHPDRNLYFTEQYTGTNGNFGGDLNWHLKNVLIGATRNGSRNVLEWNLATDASYGPRTPGGCSTCLGALTIGTGVTRNVSYYIIAHAARFVRPGSVRIASNIPGALQNVAFRTSDGTKVLIVLNEARNTQTFAIRFRGKIVSTTLPSGAVGTYVWK